jgi:hypothetical protein
VCCILFAGNGPACHIACFSPDVRNAHVKISPWQSNTRLILIKERYFPPGHLQKCVFIYHESWRGESETATKK